MLWAKNKTSDDETSHLSLRILPRHLLRLPFVPSKHPVCRKKSDSPAPSLHAVARKTSCSALSMTKRKPISTSKKQNSSRCYYSWRRYLDTTDDDSLIKFLKRRVQVLKGWKFFRRSGQRFGNSRWELGIKEWAGEGEGEAVTGVGA